MVYIHTLVFVQGSRDASSNISLVPRPHACMHKCARALQKQMRSIWLLKLCDYPYYESSDEKNSYGEN